MIRRQKSKLQKPPNLNNRKIQRIQKRLEKQALARNADFQFLRVDPFGTMDVLEDLKDRLTHDLSPEVLTGHAMMENSLGSLKSQRLPETSEMQREREIIQKIADIQSYHDLQKEVGPLKKIHSIFGKVSESGRSVFYTTIETHILSCKKLLKRNRYTDPKQLELLADYVQLKYQPGEFSLRLKEKECAILIWHRAVRLSTDFSQKTRLMVKIISTFQQHAMPDQAAILAFMSEKEIDFIKIMTDYQVQLCQQLLPRPTNSTASLTFAYQSTGATSSVTTPQQQDRETLEHAAKGDLETGEIIEFRGRRSR